MISAIEAFDTSRVYFQSFNKSIQVGTVYFQTSRGFCPVTATIL